MPDTSPRMTGNMAPIDGVDGTDGPARDAGRRLGDDPPSAPPPMPPPAAPPPMAAPAPPPMAATVAPPSARGDVQVGPNAVLRGAVARRTPITAQPSSLGEELRIERQKRTDAERALEEATRDAALLKRKVDQLQADMKRMRGGQAPVGDDTRDDGELQLLRGRIADLEAQLRRARAGESSGAIQMASSGRPASGPRGRRRRPSRSAIRSPSYAPRCARPTTKRACSRRRPSRCKSSANPCAAPPSSSKPRAATCAPSAKLLGVS